MEQTQQLSNESLKLAKEEIETICQKYDIVLDVTDLYDMIKNPPLNTVIKNIQGDSVIFKGHDDEMKNPDQTQNQEIVGQMAQSAMPTK